MSILIIGDTSIETCKKSREKYKNAVLLSDANFEQVDLSLPGEYFTALGDLTIDQIFNSALKSESVEYITGLPWENTNSLVQTEILCNCISRYKPVKNWQTPKPLHNISQDISRCAAGPMLWTFGCSHTEGYGLINPDVEVYGSVLSSQLKLPWRNVAQSGSSTKWSLMHIMAADIQPHDIVIWATTSAERFQQGVDFTTTNELLLSVADRTSVSFYTDPQIFWDHYNLVNIGISYLRAIKSRFVFSSFLQSSPYQLLLEQQFSRNKEWCNIHDFLTMTDLPTGFILVQKDILILHFV